MKRALIACVAACGAPHLERVPQAPEHVATRSRDAGVDAVKIVDTSIGAIWNPSTFEPHVQAPLGPSIIDADAPEPEPERIAMAMPRARIPGRRAPCFSNRDVLVGSEIYGDLADYAISMSADPPPSGRYGTCTIKNGELRDARGRLLAELHCGITIHAPGIIDDLGFEVGAKASEVAAEHEHEQIMCWGEGDDHMRCWFFADEGENEAMHYMVEATPPASNDTGPFVGAAARELFKSRTLTHFTVRLSCH